MSVVTYNGVTFNYVLTRNFSQAKVCDESGLDYLYTKFNIAVDCVWNSHVFPVGAQPDGNPLNGQIPAAYAGLRGLQPAAAMAGPSYPTNEDGLRALLNQDRKAFSYADHDGNSLVVAPSHDGGSQTDDALGPFVRELNIARLNDNTYHVSFAVEVSLAECPVPPGTQASATRHKAILSNRWSQTMGIDDHGFQTRTHAGKLVIAGGSGDAGASNFITNPPTADAYRGWVFPPIPAGFGRTSINCVLDRTGLQLGYTVVDRQQPRVLDKAGPAVKFTLEYWEEATNFGCAADAGVSVRLTSGPFDDPRDLVSLAFQMALARVGVDVDPNTGRPNVDPATGRPKVGGKKAFLGILGGSRLSERVSNDGPAEIMLRINLKKVFADASARKADDAKFTMLDMGVDASRVGLSPPLVQDGRPKIPGTVNPLKFSGAGPGDFGTAGVPGVQLFAQVLASPCASIGRPGQAKWVISADADGYAQTPVPQTPRETLPPGRVAVLGDFESRPDNSTDGGTVNDALKRSFLVMNDSVAKVTLQIVDALPGEYEDDGYQTAWSLSNYSHLYTNYAMDVTVDTDHHALQMAVASNVPCPSRIINLAQPTSTKVIRWTCERVGAPPELPGQDTGDPNDVFRRKTFTVQTKTVAPDGVNYVYLRSGEYHYVLRNAVTEADAVNVGSTPNLRATVAENMLPGGGGTWVPALRVRQPGELPRPEPIAYAPGPAGPPVTGDNR